MNPPAQLSELILALEFEMDDQVHKFDRATGMVTVVEGTVLRAIEEGDDETLTELPDWQKPEVEIARAMHEDTSGRFIDPPDKCDFHEYRHMERFIGTVSDPDAADQLSRAVRGKGAFRHFKNTAHHLGLLQSWYEFRDAAMKQFTLDWAQANGVQVIDDVSGRPRR